MSAITSAKSRRMPVAAAQLSDGLRAEAAAGKTVNVTVGKRVVKLPAELVAALTDLLDDISQGRDVTSAPAGLPLGTEVASELLGVSRPWLTTLLDRGHIPSSRIGSKRRVRLGDLLAYRRSDDARRREDLTWEFLDEQ